MAALGKMVGFVLTKDYDKARAFYERVLGGEFVSLDQFALVVKLGGHQIRISKVGDFTPLPSTILGWEVSDIEGAIDSLTRRGVAFEQYPFVQDKKRGVWTAPGGNKIAWFKDPDGNVLSISQQ
jgi:catechol 2,3-dioxygenase-like lactoylglutathione lyase family enzyme